MLASLDVMVPMLEDGEFRLTESSAILKYLASRFELPEYPTELKARARVDEREPEAGEVDPVEVLQQEHDQEQQADEQRGSQGHGDEREKEAEGGTDQVAGSPGSLPRRFMAVCEIAPEILCHGRAGFP